MRNAFAAEITALALSDDRIVLLSGDIGNRLFDKYKAACPDRFFNCGIAEANMMSAAAGMALSGLRPVVYTIAPFVTTRCLDQISVDVCYHNVPVVIVGTGAGMSYASLGGTHRSCEDIAFMRMLPNMTVVCPGDSWEVRAALKAAIQHPGPVYIRLGKKGEPDIHDAAPPFTIGKALVVREGDDVCLLSTGNMLPTALQTAIQLGQSSISAQVVSFHTVKPLDQEFLISAFSHFTWVATLEEHSRMGGLGGSVAEWLADQAPQKARLYRFGTADTFLHEAGEQEHAREAFGLSAHQITEKILHLHEQSKVIQ